MSPRRFEKDRERCNVEEVHFLNMEAKRCAEDDLKKKANKAWGVAKTPNQNPNSNIMYWTLK